MCRENYQEVRDSKSEEIGNAVRVNRVRAIALEMAKAEESFPELGANLGARDRLGFGGPEPGWCGRVSAVVSASE